MIHYNRRHMHSFALSSIVSLKLIITVTKAKELSICCLVATPEARILGQLFEQLGNEQPQSIRIKLFVRIRQRVFLFQRPTSGRSAMRALLTRCV